MATEVREKPKVRLEFPLWSDECDIDFVCLCLCLFQKLHLFFFL